MNQDQASVKTAEFALRAASLFLLFTGVGILVYTLSTANRETIALLTGAVLGVLIATPCAVLVTLIVANQQRQPHQNQTSYQHPYDQQWHEMTIQFEHAITEHVLDGSWPVVMPSDPRYEQWRVIKPNELVVIARREIVRRQV